MNWREDRDSLVKTFTFPDFASALAFVNRIGELADKANHHPELELSWGKVVVRLTTHSVGHVTDADLTMSKEIDGL